MRVDEVLDLELDMTGVASSERMTTARVNDVECFLGLAEPSVVLHADLLVLLQEHREPGIG